MQVKDIMVHEVELLRPDQPLRDAAAMIKGLGLEPLPVWDGSQVVGMLTDRSIKAKAMEIGLAAGSVPVREAMDRHVAFCYQDEDASKAVQALSRGAETLPGLVVMDREQRVVGVAPAQDLREHGLGLPRVTGGVAASEPTFSLSEDQVDHNSEESYPASDPPPPPSSMGCYGPDDCSDE